MSVEKYTKSFSSGTLSYIDAVDPKSNRRINAVGLNPFNFKPHGLKRIIERQIDRDEATVIFISGRNGKDRTIDSKCQILRESNSNPDMETKRKKFVSETMDALIQSNTFFIIKEVPPTPSSPHDLQTRNEEH